MNKPAKKKPIPSVADVASWQQSEATYIAGRSFIDGAEALAHELNAKWGVGRLRLLVDDDLRARFDTQRVKFARAMNDGELEDVRREAPRMVNAWRALDQAATLAGASELSPLVWEVTLPNGKVAALVRTMADQQAVANDGRAMVVYSLDEIATLLHGFPELVKAAKEIPGADVVSVRPISDPLHRVDNGEWADDPIPF